MSHLLAISVGPVQEFIAAARRTRDLWFGSYLLSEVSRAVAKVVESNGGTLIFPASSDAHNVANVILADLKSGDPRLVAAEAKKAAKARWVKFAEEARGEAPGVTRTNIWDDQVNDVIEFYAAWVARSSDYQADRARVMRLLAGRKSCRDFGQSSFNDTGLPKSSLDGERATVLVGPKSGELRETYRDKWPKNLRLSPGEQLDVIGVAKRLGKKERDPDPSYPSVARVAAETWLQGFRGRSEFKALKTACQSLVAKGLNTVREEHYQHFPFEGTVIFKDRHPDLRKELGLGEHDLDEVASALEDIGGEPNPYLAVLVADGDKMGEAISGLESADAHREFSQALAGFAGKARNIVNENHGVLIYAGGDDVLAFVPVDKCLECARALRTDFYNRMKRTLSVGVAIGHFMENLEDLLEYGRKAEKDAKGVDGKDALAVHLHKRGGAPIKVRARWEDNPEERIKGYAESLNRDDLPGKLAYELRMLADLYKGWRKETEEDKQTIASAISQDVKRLLSKKQPGSGKAVTLGFSHVKDSQSLNTFAEELLIATALKQSGGVAS